MKIFATLAIAAAALAVNASAATEILFCGSFHNDNANFGAGAGSATGNVVCPGSGALGTLSSFSAQVLLQNGYSSGNPAQTVDSTATNFQSTVGGFNSPTTLYT